MEWYVERNQVRKGPITEDQMQRHARAGHLRPSDLVWNSSMPEWRRADRVTGLMIAPSPDEVGVRQVSVQEKRAGAASHWPGAHPDASIPTGNYLRDHWTGRQGLTTSFWVNTVCVSLLLQISIWGVLGLVNMLAPPFSFLPLLLAPVLYAAILIWQYVGLYRCALAHIFLRPMRLRFLAHLSLIWSVLPLAFVPMLAVAIISATLVLAENTRATFNEVSAQIEMGRN